MKNDSSLLEISLSRNMSGKLEAEVEAATVIEDLMKTQSDGEITDCFSYTRNWVAKSRDSKTTAGLPIYVVPARDELVATAHDHGYDLWIPGEALYQGRGRRRDGRPQMTNLSFLRVVGISKAPVTLVSDEMLSRATVDQIGRQISNSVRAFFDDNLREHAVNISVLMEA